MPAAVIVVKSLAVASGWVESARAKTWRSQHADPAGFRPIFVAETQADQSAAWANPSGARALPVEDVGFARSEKIKKPEERENFKAVGRNFVSSPIIRFPTSSIFQILIAAQNERRDSANRHHWRERFVSDGSSLRDATEQKRSRRPVLVRRPTRLIGGKPQRTPGLLFLPRHGRGHRILLPHELNHRANIYALRSTRCALGSSPSTRRR